MSEHEKQEVLELFAQLGLATEEQRLRFRYSFTAEPQKRTQTFILMENTTAQATLPEGDRAELE